MHDCGDFMASNKQNGMLRNAYNNKWFSICANLEAVVSNWFKSTVKEQSRIQLKEQAAGTTTYTLSKTLKVQAVWQNILWHCHGVANRPLPIEARNIIRCEYIYNGCQFLNSQFSIQLNLLKELMQENNTRIKTSYYFNNSYIYCMNNQLCSLWGYLYVRLLLFLLSLLLLALVRKGERINIQDLWFL